MTDKEKHLEPREHELRVMLSPEEHAAFRKEAKESGISLASWARMKLRQAAGLARVGG